MERTVGKYFIVCTSSDVTYDNFSKFDVWVNGVRISKKELFFNAALVLRYSENPKDIQHILKVLVFERKNWLRKLKELI